MTITVILIKSFTFAALKAHVVKLVDTSDLGSDAAEVWGFESLRGHITLKVMVISKMFKLLFTVFTFIFIINQYMATVTREKLVY